MRPFPEHALRSRLLAGCGRGPELFLARRAAFAASLAAACAFGYVGGVGDRHTSNVLLQVWVGVDAGLGCGVRCEGGVR